jgi:hypothetical protein
MTLALRHPQAALAPAALTPDHEALGRDCLACHVLGRGVPDARCVKCHALARIGLFTTKGRPIPPNMKASFHQRLRETRCLACHIGHPGSKRAAAHTGFTHDMLAQQDRDDCAACHAAPGDALHRGVSGSCGTCHTIDRWKPAAFDHAKYWQLDRDHSATCVTCHPGNAFAQYGCNGCHEHSPERVLREHAKEDITNLDDCVRCHRSPRDREGGEHGEHEGKDRRHDRHDEHEGKNGRPDEREGDD